jgi:type IV pilus biogenesis protein CpaD/CtpE
MMMLNRSKLYAVALLAAVFAAGVAVGTGVSAAARDRRSAERPERERREGGYAERLSRDLGLTTAQRDSVQIILDRYQEPMSAMWTAMRPRMDSIRSAIRADILGVLDSSQQEQYRLLMHRGDSARTAREREGHRGR